MSFYGIALKIIEVCIGILVIVSVISCVVDSIIWKFGKPKRTLYTCNGCRCFFEWDKDASVERRFCFSCAMKMIAEDRLDRKSTSILNINTWKKFLDGV